MNRALIVDVPEVTNFVSALFEAAGLAPDAAKRVADALIDADVSGRGSHGIQLADLYLERLVNGTMSTASKPELVSEDGGCVVLDAADMEGHLAAEEAMKIAIAKAREFGVSAVSMRRVFHCGVMGRYIRMAAEEGCAAFAMCNVKPLMAAPGGLERLVGTNPIAIGFPVENHAPVILDMATTEGAMGSIRQKLAAGEKLPENWALDAEGNSTTDPAEALAGFLLPVGGAKGFGLSFVIDLLSGALATGGFGSTLGELAGDKPYNASLLFIVLDINRFRALDAFLKETRAGVERVQNSKKAEGTDRIFVPGERSAEAIETNNGTIPVSLTAAKALRERAFKLSVPIPAILEI
ncbi:MAG: Ldh family oxidoreductase [Rhizobiaceae bacterium]|nr:Ldh family oxidoreductase [Rhizobiaceae bacterium]